MVDIQKAVSELMEELNKGAGKAIFPQPDIMPPQDVSRRLEHSLLTANMSKEVLLAECRVARKVQAAVVCVAPYYVADAAAFLTGSSVAVCAAVGFPSALMSTEAKAADVHACVISGASEIDVAINIAAIKSGDYARAEIDFLAAVEAAKGRAIIKAVFEHGSYNDFEKVEVLDIIGRSGVPFIKIQNMTSGHGARREEIHFVRSILGDSVKIKIDGGVKTLDQAIELFKAGAYRIGLTATKAVADEDVKYGNVNK